MFESVTRISLPDFISGVFCLSYLTLPYVTGSISTLAKSESVYWNFPRNESTVERGYTTLEIPFVVGRRTV